MLAQQAVFVAGKAHWLSQQLRAKEIDRKLPPRPEFKLWLRLYRGHGRVFVGMADFSPDAYGPGEELRGSAAGDDGVFSGVPF